MIAVVAAVIVCSIVAYNYSVEQTRQKGLEFGMELERIQDDVRELQETFYSTKVQWEEGDVSDEGLSAFYDNHVLEFGNVISGYDSLEPPEIFDGSVQLLKLSSQAQLESDLAFIEWMRTEDEQSKERSDALLQDALEYEMLGLVEFYSAKTGTLTYDDPDETFTPPRTDIIRKVDTVTEHMLAMCDEKLGVDMDTGDPDGSVSGMVSQEWSDCVAEAEEWRKTHMPQG